MISCLTSYIGLEDITADPKSGRYINELPGIETTQFDLIRKEEVYDTEQAWQRVENRAIRKFENKVNQWAAKYYDRYSYVEDTVTGQYDSNTDIGTSNFYAGWFFNSYASLYKNMKVVIPWIDLYCSNSAVSSIKVFNGTTGDILDTISFTSTANSINRITINKEYSLAKYPNLFIAYDESEIQTMKSSTLPIGYRANFAQKRVSKSSAVIQSNLSDVGNTGQGMILCYSIACGIENFVCQRLSLFEEPYMYLLGAEFCRERISSDRVSRYTLLDREEAVKLRDEFEEQFVEMLQGVLKGLKVPGDGYCFNCERLINYKILLP
jgi:hypothetical protein